MAVFFFEGTNSGLGGKITFPLPRSLLPEIFKSNAELSVSIPEALGNAEVGTQSVMRHVLC